MQTCCLQGPVHRKASTEGICTSSAVCFLVRPGCLTTLRTFLRSCMGFFQKDRPPGKTATGKYCGQYLPETLRCAPGERGTGKFRGSGAVRSGRGKSPAPPSATPRETATGLCYNAPRTYREYGEKATTALLQINDKAWKEYTWTKIM